MKFDYGHHDQNFEHFSNHKRVNGNIEKTTVLNARKTAVLVLMPGLVDQSWSRTLPSLMSTFNSHSKTYHVSTEFWVTASPDGHGSAKVMGACEVKLI